jgi:hypothetical protein
MSKTKISLALLASLAFGVCANAQTSNGVTTSTDPGKAAAIEQHASELKANQAPSAAAKPMHMHSAKHHPMHHTVHHAKIHTRAKHLASH